LKESIPAQAAFYQVSADASRLAIGAPDAQYLNGLGDMLFRASPAAPLQRLQACHVIADEALPLVSFWEKQASDHPQWVDNQPRW
jgi:DNA segregation ATPase FtsK/SpoIIIE-like protein